MSRDFKRVVVISDLHCGHVVGLTHPDFNPSYPRGSERFKLAVRRRELYKFYTDRMEKLQPIDILIVNGDAIDGKGPRSGSTELLTTDRDEQVEMAAVAIREAKAGQIYISYGTPYHTGKEEDWEDLVAKEVKADKIGSHDWLDVNGLILDYRHHVGSSSIPHGRHTAPARERLWNVLWAEWDEYPKSDVLIRSHVHYLSYNGAFGWLVLTTPALQGMGSKYGARRMSGTVDFGLVHFDIRGKGDFSWDYHILKPRRSRQHVIVT